METDSRGRGRRSLMARIGSVFSHDGPTKLGKKLSRNETLLYACLDANVDGLSTYELYRAMFPDAENIEFVDQQSHVWTLITRVRDKLGETAIVYDEEKHKYFSRRALIDAGKFSKE